MISVVTTMAHQGIVCETSYLVGVDECREAREELIRRALRALAERVQHLLEVLLRSYVT
jgi:hypothetical protein